MTSFLDPNSAKDPQLSSTIVRSIVTLPDAVLPTIIRHLVYIL